MPLNLLIIDYIYVKPDYRNKGIATAIFPLIADLKEYDAVGCMIGAMKDRESTNNNIIEYIHEDNEEKTTKLTTITFASSKT